MLEKMQSIYFHGYTLADYHCSYGCHFSWPTFFSLIHWNCFEVIKLYYTRKKNSKNATYFALREAPLRPATAWHIFWKALVMLILSHWHLTLRFTVFEIIAVKYLSESPKFQPLPFWVLQLETLGDVTPKIRDNVQDRPPSMWKISAKSV